MSTITLNRIPDALAALKNEHLAQSLYDEIEADVIGRRNLVIVHGRTQEFVPARAERLELQHPLVGRQLNRAGPRAVRHPDDGGPLASREKEVLHAAL